MHLHVPEVQNYWEERREFRLEFGIECQSGMRNYSYTWDIEAYPIARFETFPA
jgi:hypothetical protein